jgi:Mrp family chromosome partitioning ATPase
VPEVRVTSGYWTVLRRHVALVTVMGLAGLLLGVWFNSQQEHYYEASADVRLSQVASPFKSSDGTKADLSRALQTQIDIATGDDVRARLKGTAGERVDAVVALNGEKDELRFTCQADDAKTAADAANAWAAAYVAELQAETDDIVEQYRTALNTQYTRIAQEIAVVDAERQTASPARRASLDLRRDVLVTEIKALAGRRALDDNSVPGLISGQVVRKSPPPSEPANDEPVRDVLLGLCGGLVLGYIAACLVEARRDLVRAPEDVTLVAPSEPVLGPVDTGADLATVTRLSAGPAYVSLRSEALAVASEVHPPVFAVVSASGEAESAGVALGLALALRRQGQWVLLVDADTERAGKDTLLPTDASPGLAGILFDGSPAASSVSTVQWGDSTELLVLQTGRLSIGDLAAPAVSAALEQLIAEHQLDAVVISAGAATSPDATAVTVAANSVLVVATLRRSRRRQVARAVHRQDLLAPRPRAVVLAKAARRSASGRRKAKGSDKQATASPVPAAPAAATEEGVTGAPRRAR